MSEARQWPEKVCHGAPGEVLHGPPLEREDLVGDRDDLEQVGEDGHRVDVVVP